MRTIKICFCVATAVTAMVAVVQTAQSALLAYEPFDYTAGDTLLNQSGGIGFSQAWQTNSTHANNALITAGGFGYTDQFGNTLLTTGNRVHVTGDGTATGDNLGGNTGNGQPRRALSFNRGTDTQTTWVSLLALRTGGTFPYTSTLDGQTINYGRGTSVQLFQGTGSERLTIGRASQNSETILYSHDTWGLVNRGSANYTVASTVPWASTPADLLLLRIDQKAGDDRVNAPDIAYMWINPANLGAEPDINTATIISNAGTTGYERDYWFDTIRIFGGSRNTTVGYGAIDVDEIRIGETFGDVVPLVPEPSAVSLLALGGLALALRRRK